MNKNSGNKKPNTNVSMNPSLEEVAKTALSASQEAIAVVQEQVPSAASSSSETAASIPERVLPQIAKTITPLELPISNLDRLANFFSYTLPNWKNTKLSNMAGYLVQSRIFTNTRDATEYMSNLISNGTSALISLVNFDVDSARLQVNFIEDTFSYLNKEKSLSKLINHVPLYEFAEKMDMEQPFNKQILYLYLQQILLMLNMKIGERDKRVSLAEMIDNFGSVRDKEYRQIYNTLKDRENKLVQSFVEERLPIREKITKTQEFLLDYLNLLEDYLLLLIRYEMRFLFDENLKLSNLTLNLNMEFLKINQMLKDPEVKDKAQLKKKRNQLIEIKKTLESLPSEKQKIDYLIEQGYSNTSFSRFYRMLKSKNLYDKIVSDKKLSDDDKVDLLSESGFSEKDIEILKKMGAEEVKKLQSSLNLVSRLYDILSTQQAFVLFMLASQKKSSLLTNVAREKMSEEEYKELFGELEREEAEERYQSFLNSISDSSLLRAGQELLGPKAMETYSKGKTAKRPLEASVALLGSIMESSSRKNKSNIFVPVSRVINYHPPNLDSHFRQTKYTLAQEREYLETRKQKTLETILKMLTKPTTATVKEVSGKDIYLFETSKEMASARGKLVVSNIERQRPFLAKGESSNKPSLPQCILYINNEFINKHIDVMKSTDVPRVAPIYMKKDTQKILDEAQIIEDQIETLESKEGKTASEENLMEELIAKKEAIERELLVPDPKDPVNYEIRRDADYFLALDGQNRFSVIAYLLKELRKLSREINIEVLDICLESELRLLPTRFCSEALTLREYMYKKGLFNDFPQSNSGKVKTKKVLHCGYPERREKAIQISSDSQLSETESQTSSSSNYEDSFKSYIENLSKQEELVREQYDEDKVKFIEALESYMKQLETALKKMDDLSEKTSMELISLLKTFKLPRDRDIDKLIEKLLELKEFYLYQLGYYKKDETLKTHLTEIDRILNDYTKVNQKYLALKEQIEQRKKVESMGVKDMEKLFDSIHSDIDKLSKKTRGHIISTVKKVAKNTNNSGKRVVAAAEAVVRKELDEVLQVLPLTPSENEGATQINPEDLVETLHPNERIVARSILSDYVKLSEVDKLSNLVRKAIEELIDLNKHRGKPGYKILLNKIQNELTDLNPLLSAELITLDEFLKESKRISDNIDLLSKQSLVKKRVSMSDIQTLQIIQEKIKNSKRLIERLIADVQASLKGISGTKQRLNIEVEKKQEEELRKIQLDELEIENEKLIKELEQEEKVIERLRALRKEQPRNEQITTSFEEKITVATRKQRETIEKLKQLEKIKRALLEGSEEMGEEPLGEEASAEQPLERPEEQEQMELVEQRGEPSEIRDKRGRNNNSNYERRVKQRRNYEESGVGLRNASQSTTGFTDEELMLTNTEHKLPTPTMPSKKKQAAKKPSTRTASTRRSTRSRRSQETESESE